MQRRHLISGVIGLVLLVGGTGIWIATHQALPTINAASVDLNSDDTEMNATADAPDADVLDIPLAKTVDDRNTFMDAYSAAADKQHLRSLYEEYLPKIGANGLIDSIQTITPVCHDEGHELGKVIFAKLQDPGQALAVCRDACSSGCMHGVLMEYFSKGTVDAKTANDTHVDLTDVEKALPTFCTSGSITSLYLPGDCAHGMGHAIMFLSNYDIQASMKVCDQFSTYPMQYYCATGAYMEYENVHRVDDDKNKPVFYPCDVSPYPAACFRYRMADVVPRSYQAKVPFKTLVDGCLALDDNTEHGCFHGLGNGNMGYIAGGQLTVAQVCQAGTDDDIKACIDGVMERLGKYYPERVTKVCNAEDGWKKDLCNESGTRKMYSLDKSFDLYKR